MSKFLERIKQIASENEKVAMFVDMDGTITAYDVYPESDVNKNMADNYQTLEPVNYVIDILKKIKWTSKCWCVYINIIKRQKHYREKRKFG